MKRKAIINELIFDELDELDVKYSLRKITLQTKDPVYEYYKTNFVLDAKKRCIILRITKKKIFGEDIVQIEIKSNIWKTIVNYNWSIKYFWIATLQ